MLLIQQSEDRSSILNSNEEDLSILLPDQERGVFQPFSSAMPLSGAYCPQEDLKSTQSSPLSGSKALQSLKIPSFFNYIESVPLDLFQVIHSLTIQRHSCQQIHSFSLISCPFLESVHVGYNCFYDAYPALLPQTPLRSDPTVIIQDCPNLISLIIEPWCFVLNDGLILESEDE